MSGQYGNEDFFKKELAIEPTISNQIPIYQVNKGPSDISSKMYTSSTSSNNSIQFSNIVPLSNTFLDRRMLLHFQVDFTLRASGGYTGPVFPGGNLNSGVCALRWLPIQNTANSLTAYLNSSSVSINPNNFLEAVCRYSQNKNYENTWLSLAPSMHDYGPYEDTYNTNLNPLASAFNNSVQETRGSIKGVILSDSNGVAVVRYKWTEPVFISPLLYSGGTQQAFWGLSTFSLNIALNNLNSLLSYDNVNGTVLSSVEGSFAGEQRLELFYYSPYSPIDPNQRRFYPLNIINSYPSTANSNVLSGATVKATSQNINLSGIPSQIYIYVKRSLNRMDTFKTDTYGYINQLSLYFANKPNNYSTYSEEAIYNNLMVKNGWQYPFNLTKDYIGNVICIEGTDLPLSTLEAPGMALSTSMYCTVDYKNLYPDQTDFTLYVIVCYNGIFEIYDQTSSRSSINLLTKDEIGRLELATKIDQEKPVTAENLVLGSGDPFNAIKNFATKGYKNIKKGAKTIKQFQKDHPEVMEVLSKGTDYLEKALPAPLSLGTSVGLDIGNKFLDLLAMGNSPHKIYKLMKSKGYTDKQLKGAGLVFSGGKVVFDKNKLLK
jgi:hypothetical protein